MAGILYLCATPIGNLEDMTYRCVRILKEVDLIAAEDTRNSIKLLNHFEIDTPMTSYHEFNKIEKAHTLLAALKEGKNIAVITDAGTPGISDPGEELVAMCYEEDIEVNAVPGAAACITAVTSSGQACRRFSFEAFLPKDKKEKQQVLESLKNEANFPQFLMIDTPNKEGIDKENLIKNIGLLAEADKYTEEMKTQYQIILTTGIDTYPEEFKKNVF